MSYVGGNLHRVEDRRHLRGQARFAGDLSLPGMLNMAVLRSPHPHARIARIDPGAAAALPGVAAILTAADFPGLRPIPMRLGASPALVPYLQVPLAGERVRFVGEPVAAVVAADRYLAEDALDLIRVDYEPLPAVTSVAAAVAPSAPLLFPVHGSNVAEVCRTEVGDVDRALAGAAHCYTQRFAVGRHTAVPLETRCLTAAPEPHTGRLAVWGPTKVPHFNRLVLADLLGLAETDLHFMETDVGGGFGVRGEFYPEDFLVPAAALRLRRPVQYVEDRREHLMATNHSREQEHEITLALDADGRILALADRFWCNMGAYIRTHGNVVAACTAGFLPGPYRVPAYRSEFHCVLTNKTPTGTYRAPGRYEGNFVRERMFDFVAGQLGTDPVEFRRRHLLRPDELPRDVGTVVQHMPVILDPADYPSLLEQALAGLAEERRRLAAAAPPDDRRCWGVGLACFAEKTGTGPWEYARVALDRTGRVTVATGATNVGQGIETALTLIVSDALGAPPEQIRVVHGDTDQVAYGVGSFASRSAVMAGNAAAGAAARLRQQILQVAAGQLEADPAGLELRDGQVQVRGGPGRSLTLAQVARGADRPAALSAEEFFHATQMTFSGGVHAAVVAVDPDTGQVEVRAFVVACDVGRAIHPEIVRGQLAGGVAQGIGGALLEELAYDNSGQLLAASFMDYLLPTATDVPAPRLLVVEYPSTLNPLGVRGCGEGGISAAGAAIAAAVEQALAHRGVRITRLPIRPGDLVQMARGAEALAVGDREGTGRGVAGAGQR